MHNVIISLTYVTRSRYDLAPEALHSKQVHLTNAAIARPSVANGKQKATNTDQDELEAQYDNGTWTMLSVLYIHAGD